jgi:hypothetical protein
LFQGFNTSFEDYLDNKTLLHLICQQKELNFDPGSSYKYSSSGYILLTEIIERVSGKTLRTFAQEVLFRPLGMRNTFFSDNHSEVIKDRVESYRKTPVGYERLLKGFDIYGDGGVLTTVQDLAKWDRAFYSNILGKDFAAKMYQRGKLSNGWQIDYASGLIAGKYKGLAYYQHQGGMIQFDSYMIRYPEQHFSIIVLSNSWSNAYTGYIAERITDLFLNNKFKSTTPLGNLKPMAVDSNDLKQLAGHYWNIDDNYYNLIIYRNDSLFFDNTDGFSQYLVPIKKNTFQMRDFNSQISFSENGTIMQYMDSSFNNPVLTFEKYQPSTPQSLSELQDCMGDYFSGELDTWYHFYDSEGAFFLRINDNLPMQLWPNPSSRVRWNSKNKVWIGFTELSFTGQSNLSLGDTRVKSIDFVKLDSR